ncbi:hypothetical protein RRG08_043303 [Elysia crispata]|uniref:SMB domain-containing protein n=1 Tax=Elysia crispata TaxID=231223 RepID=A0AAE1CNW5_9GAST|nr:hypothetical protein RRG08_043303 [Elysia crispata]
MCGASDLETFTESHKAEYTYEDRCSHALTLGKIIECGCDEICLVCGDCCADFLDQCPEIDARGRIIYSHLIAVTMSCSESGSPVVLVED